MARTQPAHEGITQDISVQRLIEAAGLRLAAQGEGLIGPCPRHPEDGNGVVVHPNDNTWECPTCEKKGGPVEWVMFSRRVSRTRAIDILSADAVGDSAGSIVWPDADDELLHAVVGYYHETLLHEREALEYLSRRGLHNEDMIRKLRLGYANRTLGYRLPSRNSGLGKTLRKRLESVGILRSTGHEHLSGSITVPVLDAAGKAMDIYGRKTTPSLRQGTPQHLFLRENPPEPWLLDPTAQGEILIITASVMDALSWWMVGYKLVLVTPTMQIVESHLAGTLASKSPSRVVLAHPRELAIESLVAPVGFEVLRAVFPEGKDANALLVDGRDLQAVVRNAEWVASPASPSTPPTPELKPDDNDVSHGDEVVLNLGDRRWRIRGLGENKTPETMRVNIMVTRDDVGMHVDTFDAYSSRHRTNFIKEASIELGVPEQVIKTDLGKVLVHLETLQDKLFQAKEDLKDDRPELTAEQQAEALALLKDASLMGRIAGDMTTAGLVGENANKLIVYLAATSRLLDDPLAVVIQSTSGSGKSSLLEGVLKMMPPESTRSFSAMTGQSLYYLGQDDLRHRILSVSEERGAAKASYSLKLLQSERTITIASTGKDPGTGRLKTETYTVEGPVALMMTTTDADLDEELSNRCVVVTVDEGREQTRAIHARQRHQETLDGLLGKLQRDKVIDTHRNAQRLLKPLHVVNPFAGRLTFADHAPRTRREHQKYLALIRAVPLLHQHQRPVRRVEHGGQTVDYIEVSADDIKIANGLFQELTGKSLDDLLPQTRRLLVLAHEMVMARSKMMGLAPEVSRFTRRMLREHVGWGQTQLRVHLSRLIEMEYILAHRAGTGATLYELAWSGEGQDGSPFVMGLADPVEPAGQDRANGGPVSVGGRVAALEESAGEMASERDPGGHDARKTHRGKMRKAPSYRGGSI